MSVKVWTEDFSPATSVQPAAAPGVADELAESAAVFDPLESLEPSQLARNTPAATASSADQNR
jgi:hypothetical protein